MYVYYLQNIMKRIISVEPQYDRQRWKRDWARTTHILHNICEYPYLLAEPNRKNDFESSIKPSFGKGLDWDEIRSIDTQAQEKLQAIIRSTNAIVNLQPEKVEKPTVDKTKPVIPALYMSPRGQGIVVLESKSARARGPHPPTVKRRRPRPDRVKGTRKLVDPSKTQKKQAWEKKTDIRPKRITRLGTRIRYHGKGVNALVTLVLLERKVPLLCVNIYIPRHRVVKTLELEQSHLKKIGITRELLQMCISGSQSEQTLHKLLWSIMK